MQNVLTVDRQKVMANNISLKDVYLSSAEENHYEITMPSSSQNHFQSDPRFRFTPSQVHLSSNIGKNDELQAFFSRLAKALTLIHCAPPALAQPIVVSCATNWTFIHYH